MGYFVGESERLYRQILHDELKFHNLLIVKAPEQKNVEVSEENAVNESKIDLCPVDLTGGSAADDIPIDARSAIERLRQSTIEDEKKAEQENESKYLIAFD